MNSVTTKYKTDASTDKIMKEFLSHALRRAIPGTKE
jgi:hypothetical protein